MGPGIHARFLTKWALWTASTPAVAAASRLVRRPILRNEYTPATSEMGFRPDARRRSNGSIPRSASCSVSGSAFNMAYMVPYCAELKPSAAGTPSPDCAARWPAPSARTPALPVPRPRPKGFVARARPLLPRARAARARQSAGRGRSAGRPRHRRGQTRRARLGRDRPLGPARGRRSGTAGRAGPRAGGSVSGSCGHDIGWRRARHGP